VSVGKRVYFMRPCGTEGPIKIGCSKDCDTRLRSVEIWSPVILELVATVPGEHREENILHQMFGEDRLHGEWFKHSPKLQSLIDYVVKAGKLPPLDYSLSPYASKRPSAMKRRADPKETTSKSQMTARVRRAERRVWTFQGIGELRPVEIDAIIRSYSGFDRSPPTAEDCATLEDYIAKLNELPAADNTLAKFNSWHHAVKARAA
jgi:Meiotically up-regulated gene 113